MFLFADANIVYIDDIQLEEGEVANSYNFIENSDFSEGITDWQLSASKIDNEEAVSTASFFECVKFDNNQNTALKAKMNPLYNLSFHKEYPICGKVGELYTVSFWYKNEGIEGILPYARNYVSIDFHPIDDNQPGHCVITSPTFNRNDDRWQYYSYRIRSLEDFDKITVTFYQNMEENDFYITNLSFYKNVTSGDYKYDLEGNLISYENQSKEENIFKYDRKNQLINATTPMEQDFKYEYDNQKTDRVLSAIASNGLANEIEYDLNGNPIW